MTANDDLLIQFKNIGLIYPFMNTWHKPDSEVQNHFRGCLLGGAVGDALGAPVEFMRRAEIIKLFGNTGITDFVPVYGKLGAITDDTQMMLFTAEGVLRGFMRGTLRGICHPPSVIGYSYLRWLHTQGYQCSNLTVNLNGWLIKNPELFSSRAPGHTCISALRNKENIGEQAQNQSKGCGGVMRVAPIGMFFKGLASFNCSPSVQSRQLTDAFELGCQAAGLTHGHPTGKLAAGAFSLLIFLLLQGKSLNEAVNDVLTMLSGKQQSEETHNAILKAVELANSRVLPIDAIRQLGEGWIAEEALAIGLYSALIEKDFESGVILAVNHDGDSDSTGLIAGHMLGAIHGLKMIPQRWLELLELREVLEEVADDLATAGQWRLGDYNDRESEVEEDFYCKRYPPG